MTFNHYFGSITGYRKEATSEKKIKIKIFKLLKLGKSIFNTQSPKSSTYIHRHNNC